MALYPQTTCFYKAVINQLPQTAQDEYQVLFEDSSYTEGFSPPLMVAQRYVIAIKEKKKWFQIHLTLFSILSSVQQDLCFSLLLPTTSETWNRI
jgi:hypothetical protein